MWELRMCHNLPKDIIAIIDRYVHRHRCHLLIKEYFNEYTYGDNGLCHKKTFFFNYRHGITNSCIQPNGGYYCAGIFNIKCGDYQTIAPTPFRFTYSKGFEDYVEYLSKIINSRSLPSMYREEYLKNAGKILTQFKRYSIK
jgi:hypothetical protein